MTYKNKILKILVIGSIFCIFSFSFGGVISINNDKISDFWVVKSIDSTYADDDEYEYEDDEDDYYEHKFEREREYEDEDDNDNIKITNTSTTITTQTQEPSQTTTSQEKQNTVTTNTQSNNSVIPASNSVNQTPSAIKNNKIYQSDVCKTTYDTVTNASGTKLKIPNNVCETKVYLKDETKKYVVTQVSDLVKNIEKINSGLTFKLDSYNKLVSKLLGKISFFTILKSKTTDENLKLEYDKKILLLNEIKDIFDTKIYTINTTLNNKIEAQKLAADSAKTAQELAAQKAAAQRAAAQKAAQDAAAAKAAEAARLAAQQAAVAEAARIAAQQAAAQKAAQQKINTRTTAS